MSKSKSVPFLLSAIVQTEFSPFSTGLQRTLLYSSIISSVVLFFSGLHLTSCFNPKRTMYIKIWENEFSIPSESIHPESSKANCKRSSAEIQGKSLTFADELLMNIMLNEKLNPRRRRRYSQNLKPLAETKSGDVTSCWEWKPTSLKINISQRSRAKHSTTIHLVHDYKVVQSLCSEKPWFCRVNS